MLRYTALHCIFSSIWSFMLSYHCNDHAAYTHTSLWCATSHHTTPQYHCTTSHHKHLHCTTSSPSFHHTITESHPHIAAVVTLVHCTASAPHLSSSICLLQLHCITASVHQPFTASSSFRLPLLVAQSLMMCAFQACPAMTGICSCEMADGAYHITVRQIFLLLPHFLFLSVYSQELLQL